TGVRESVPPASGKNPARTRRSVDFPAPFGPVTVRLPPASIAKDRSEKSIRPPRSTVSLEAESCMMIKPWAAQTTKITLSSIMRVALGGKINYKRHHLPRFRSACREHSDDVARQF